MKKRKVWFTMVDSVGWKRVGPPYTNRETAVSWLPFVRASYHSKAKVSQCTVKYENGKVVESSRQALDQKFNMSCP